MKKMGRKLEKVKNNNKFAQQKIGDARTIMQIRTNILRKIATLGKEGGVWPTLRRGRIDETDI